MRLTVTLLVVVFCAVFASAQTPAQAPAQAPSDAQQFAKSGLSFNYPKGWTLNDISDDDAHQYSFTNSASDIQMRVFAHKGRISAEKLPEAKKAFIDPYIASIEKQFAAMGATPKKTSDTSEIGGVQAEGVQLAASLGGEPGAAKIYWALVGRRVVVMTLFGPDRDLKKHATAWEMLRTTMTIDDPAPAASPSPKPSP
jgi:hypothetical protein